LNASRWLPHRVTPHLRLHEVQFVVLTSNITLNNRDRDASESLAAQNAWVQRFSDLHLPGAVPLPVAAQHEARTGRVFMGQKMLEMLYLMGRNDTSRPDARWFVVVDDDAFIFVQRLVELLSRLDDTIPLLVGGNDAQISLCGYAHRIFDPGVCGLTGSAVSRDSAFLNATGRRPVFRFHSGGTGYALSAAALKLMQHSISRRSCPDAPYSDAATGACAALSGVHIQQLPGGWVSRHSPQHQAVFGPYPHFARLLSYHRLSRKRALCWAREAESAPSPWTPVECTRGC